MKGMFAVASVALLSGTVVAEDEQAQFRKGFLEGRSRFKSAHCCIVRTHRIEGFGESDAETVEHLEVWHRFDTGEVRFDCQRKRDTGFNHLDWSMRRMSWIRQQEAEHFWRPPASYHFSRGRKQLAVQYGLFCPFDVRLTGLIGGIELRKPQLLFDDVVVDWLIFRNWECQSVETGPKLVELEYRSKKYPLVRRRLLIDPNQHWVPVSDSVDQLTPGGKVVQALSESSVEWEDVEGVIVPVTAVSRSYSSGHPNKVQETSLEFDWQSVNAAVPDRMFSAESWSLPVGIVKVDMSTGKPVSKGRIGESTP